MRPSDEYYKDLELRLAAVVADVAGSLGPDGRREVEFEIDHGEYGEAMIVLGSILGQNDAPVSPGTLEELRRLVQVMGVQEDMPGRFISPDPDEAEA